MSPSPVPPGGGPDGPSPLTQLPVLPPPPLTPPDPPMVPFALAGMGLFALLGLVFWALQDRLEAAGNGSWPGICLAGVIWGVPGLLTMVRHDARRRRRRAGAVTE